MAYRASVYSVGKQAIPRNVASQTMVSAHQHDVAGSLTDIRAESQVQSQPGTMVFATPAKPRFGSSRGGAWHHPTPIQEERASFVAETPSSTRTRIAGTPSTVTSRVAETPRSGRRMSDSALTEQDEAEESDDDLGELMVMTDDEEDDDAGSGPGSSSRVIPETPLR